MEACWKCHGEGKVANTDEMEPWSAWESLPATSNLAVVMGLVFSIPCPECSKKEVTNA